MTSSTPARFCMDDGLKHQALQWFENGDHDLDTAQLLLEQRGHPEAIAYHIQQSIEKYLKGYLVANAVKPPKIHELDSLLRKASKIDISVYEPFIDLCEKATKYYFEGRYPPGPPAFYTYQELKDPRL